MLSCNETTSECTESESSEQYFECNEAPSFTDRIEPITTPEILQQTLKLDSHQDKSMPTKLTSADIFKGNAKSDSDITKVAYVRSSSVPKVETAPLPSRRISLEHKIDIGDDNEPPLIIDPLSPNAGIKTIGEVIPVGLQHKLELQGSSGCDSQDSSPNDPPTEIYLLKDNEVKTDSKNSPSEISPPLADVTQESETQKHSPGTPKEVKKSQNLSTEFDLSEQLQKILGISDKTRGDSSNETKKAEQAVKEVKISEENIVKVPSVKIDSPETQKTRYVNINIHATGGFVGLSLYLVFIAQNVTFIHIVYVMYVLNIDSNLANY